MRIACFAAFVVLTASIVAPFARGGDVSATVTGGTLKITGTSGADQFIVDQIGVIDPGQFRVIPGAGTTVNGSMIVLSFTGVKKDIVIETGGGTDAMTITNARVPRDLRLVAAGVGGDITTLNLSLVTVGRDYRAESTGGQVLLSLVASAVGRDVRAIGSDATDLLELDPTVAVGRDVRFDPRGDDDTFKIVRSDVAGDVILDSNPGITFTTLRDGNVDGTFRTADLDGNLALTFESMRVGSVNVRCGDSSDGLVFTQSLVSAKVTADLGDGQNTFVSNLSEFDGRVRLKAGSGPDLFNIASSTSFGDSLDLSLGEGANNLFTKGWSVAGDVRIRAGAAVDDLHLEALIVHGDVHCDAGGSSAIDPNSVSFDLVQVGGTLSAKAGDGADDWKLESTVIGGDLRLSPGPGESAVEISQGSMRGLRFDGDAGGDHVLIHDGPTVRRTARFALGEGANQLTIDESLFREDLRVTAGTGDDVMQLSIAAVIGGKTKVDLGGGANAGP